MPPRATRPALASCTALRARANLRAMSSAPSPAPDAEISIEPSSSAYDPSDARWRSQVQTLLASLEANVGPVRQNVTPVAGQKGGLVEIIIALGSAGAITASVEVFKAWLNRDRTRSVTITRKRGGKTEKIVVTGDNISKEILLELAKQESAK